MKKGIWKKYDRCDKRHSLERTSYDELYDDLKDSNKEWNIAHDYEWCKDQLCGELIPCYNIKPGDIYIYYEVKNNSLIPSLYLKVEKHIDHETNEEKNYIELNGSSFTCNDIEEKYIPILIQKLIEIDKNKNKHYINLLTKTYEEYTKLNIIIEKEILSEEEILFLYHMAYTKRMKLAIEKVKNRNILEDYNNLSNENKAKLFVEIKDDNICDSIKITDKNILKLIAQNKCLRFFKNTSNEIIKDKEFVKILLLEFFSSDKNHANKRELIKYLPEIYRSDIEIIELIFYNYSTALTLDIAKWIEKSKDIETLRKSKEYAAKLIDSFSRALISRNQSYYNNCLPWLFDKEAIENLDNCILIGPEETEEKEKLRQASFKTLKKNSEDWIKYNL